MCGFESRGRYQGERTDQGSGLAANECARQRVGFDFSALRLRMADRVGKVPGRKPEAAAAVAGRFESCAIRSGETSRVSDDGSGPENRRARECLVGPSPTLSSVLATTQPVKGPA